jgi:hypothetical protein
MLPEKKEFESLVREKRELGLEIFARDGEDREALIGACEEIAGIIADFEEIVAKKDRVEHAAFATKVKFSRKVRRKSKDIGRFEQSLVTDFDSKRISLPHARKMAEVLRLIKENKVQKAAETAGEIYRLLEAADKLEEVERRISEQKEQLKKAQNRNKERLSLFVALEAEPPVDNVAVARREKRVGLGRQYKEVREDCIARLKNLPIIELLKKAREEQLWGLGFPAIPKEDSNSLSSYLQSSGFGGMSAPQLAKLANASWQRLAHEMADVGGFRREVASRRGWIEGVVGLEKSGFLLLENEGSLAYISNFSGKGADIARELGELGKTAALDDAEWGRAERVGGITAQLSGFGKEGIGKEQEEIEGLLMVLEGKAGAEFGQGKNEKGQGGVVNSILGLFGMKKQG